MRYRFLFVLFFCMLGVEAFSADTLVFNVDRSSNWAFYGSDKPKARVSLVNMRQIRKKFDLKCDVRDSKGSVLYELSQSGDVAAADSSAVSFTFRTVVPGFYDMTLYNGGRYVEKVVMAYEPGKILPEDGSGDDFRMFAHQVALERRELKPQFLMLRNRDLSGKEKNVYDFKMVSRDDERINGYIAFPRGKRGLKAMVTLVQEDNVAGNPLADFTAPQDFIELVLYLKRRGEGMDIMKNWLTDMLLAVDFLSQREEVDKSAIYVQGEDYAGACAFVASAVTEGAAGAVVLSPDFTFLTGKFSVSSIADNVSAPLLLGVGLQSDAGALQEIFSVYNKVKGPKEYFVDPEREGIGRNRWKYIKEIFIKRISD